MDCWCDFTVVVVTNRGESAGCTAIVDERDREIGFAGGQVGIGTCDDAPLGQHRRKVACLGLDHVQLGGGRSGRGGVLAGDSQPDGCDAERDSAVTVRGSRGSERRGRLAARQGDVAAAGACR